MEVGLVMKKLGFSEYESKIYVALNRLANAGALEISQNSGVPRNKVYEVIDSMVERGFVMELPVKPKKYKVTSLDKLSEIVEEREKEVISLKDDTLDLIEALKEESLYGKSSEKVWIIKGQSNIVNKISYEMNNLEVEALSIFRNNAAIGSTYRNTKNAISRGVNMKMIGCVNEKSLPKIKPYLDMGVEFRVYNEELLGEFGSRMSIFDKKKCRITIGKPEVSDSKDYTTVWIESPSLVRMMRIMYMTIWNQCERVEDYCKRKGIEI